MILQVKPADAFPPSKRLTKQAWTIPYNFIVVSTINQPSDQVYTHSLIKLTRL
jgi:hypothetical protein